VFLLSTITTGFVVVVDGVSFVVVVVVVVEV